MDEGAGKAGRAGRFGKWFVLCERWVEFKTKNKYIDTKDESNPIVDNFLHTPNNIIKWSKMIKRDKFRKGKLGEVKSDYTGYQC